MRKIYLSVASLGLALSVAACKQPGVDGGGLQLVDLQDQFEALGDAPPYALPNSCYAKVVIPANYRTVQEEILVEDTRREIVSTPPVYKTVVDRVLVQEAGEREVSIPPTYKQVEEEVVVEPATEKTIVIPAKYRTITEEIVVRPPGVDLTAEQLGYRTVTRRVSGGERTLWVKPEDVREGDRVIANRDDGFRLVVRKGGTRLVKQRVLVGEEPLTKRKITRRELVEPERTRVVAVPAKTKNVARWVIDQPGTVKRVPTEAVFQEVERRVLVTPGSQQVIELDPVFETVDREELIEGPKAVWAEILCKDANPQTVRSLQSELFKRGYYTGPINGRQSPSLDAAVNDYQLDQGLATGGITFETLQALGIGA